VRPHRALAALTAIVTLISCSKGLPSYRYKMTVEVETPQGLRSGSSVIEVRTSGGGLTNTGGIQSRVQGEAVAVDLGSRGALFALLTARNDADRAAGIAPTAFPERVDKRGTAEAWGNNLRAMDVSLERARRRRAKWFAA
jgi:hypothetical protein